MSGPPSPPPLARPIQRRPSRRLFVVLVLAGLALVGGTLAYRGRAPKPIALPSQWNCLLVTFDTTRADHLSCYGYEYVETPTLDLMARNGTRYARCYSPVPITLPAHASMMTGLYPFYHGLRENGVGALAESAVTLAELVRASGYRTGAVVGAFVLAEQYGLNQGFNYYEGDFSGHEARSKFHYAERNAEAVTDLAIRWLDQAGDAPFFLWVHYFDPHAPYEAPGYQGSPATAAGYDQEIAYTDAQLDRLLARVAGIRQKTQREALIVVAGDHGESLWDHGEPTHGFFAYDDTLRVPLIVYRPSAAARNVVVETPVSLVDVFPSMLEWLRIPLPHQVHGRVLPESDAAVGESAGEARALYFETHTASNWYGWGTIEGVVVGRQKYIEAPRPEWYDLASDPEETRNLYADADPRLGALRDAFQVLKQTELDIPPLAAGPVQVTDEAAAKLQALGYLGTGMSQPSDSGGRIDPKDRIDLHRKVLEAQSELENGNLAAGLRLLGQVIENDPDNTRALYYLLDLLNEAAIRPNVVEVLRRRLEAGGLKSPFDAVVPHYVGIALDIAGRPDEAEHLLRQAAKADPENAEVNYQLAEILRRRDPAAPEPVDYLKRAHQLDPRKQEYTVALAQAYSAHDRIEPAVAVYEAALGDSPDDGVLLNNLAWLLASRTERMEEAVGLAERATRAVPDSASAHDTLGYALLRLNRAAEAVRALEKATRLDPAHGGSHYRLGLAYESLGRTKDAVAALSRAVELDQNRQSDWLEDARDRLAKLGDR